MVRKSSLVRNNDMSYEEQIRDLLKSETALDLKEMILAAISESHISKVSFIVSEKGTSTVPEWEISFGWRKYRYRGFKEVISQYLQEIAADDLLNEEFPEFEDNSSEQINQVPEFLIRQGGYLSKGNTVPPFYRVLYDGLFGSEDFSSQEERIDTEIAKVVSTL